MTKTIKDMPHPPREIDSALQEIRLAKGLSRRQFSDELLNEQFAQDAEFSKCCEQLGFGRSIISVINPPGICIEKFRTKLPDAYADLDDKIGKNCTTSDVIDFVSNILTDELFYLAALERRGQTQKRHIKDATSLAFINYCSSCLIDVCFYHKLPPPLMLTLLFHALLDTRQFGQSKHRKIIQRKRAIWALFNNPGASISEIATISGVNKSTISRWLKERAFEEDVEKIKIDIGYQIKIKAEIDNSDQFAKDTP